MLTVEGPPDGSVALTLLNDVDPTGTDARADLTGGLGLDNLTRRIDREGGELHVGRSGRGWVMAVLLPSQTPADEEVVEADQADQDNSEVGNE